MFDFVRDNKRLFQFLLLLLIVPSFVLVGLGRDMVAGQSSVASVDGKAISSAELDAAVRQRADMVRQSNPRIDPKELDTPDFRNKVLASILAERTMLAGIEKFRLTPDDDRIARQFRENPMYQAARNPDGTLNTEAVGMSSAAFLQRLRNEIAQQQFMEPGSVLSVTAKAPAKQVEEVVMQKREIQVQYFQVRDWQPKVQPTDEQLLAFFKSEGQKTRYIAAESVDVEMAVLDLAALQARVKIADEAVKAHYDANIRRSASAEERKASVIVIGFEASGGKDAAKKKADAALAAAKADPAKVNKPVVILILTYLVILVTMVYGPIAAMLVEMFPTRIRYTSMSLPYHIGNGWFGGLLPTTAFAIVAQTGNMYNGLWYPIIVASFTFVVGLLFVRETKDVDIYAHD